MGSSLNLMRRIQQLIHSIVTYGEQPETVSQRAPLWVSYLDQFKVDYGTLPWLAELLRGCAEHVWWRVTTSTARSSLSTGAAATLAATASLGLIGSGYDDFLSIAAEAHSALGLLAAGLALAIRPWSLLWKRLAPGCALCASGLFHLAVVNNFVVWFDYVLVAGLVIAASGLAYIAASGLRTRKPLGKTRFGVWSVFIGASFVGLAQLLWAFQPTNVFYSVSSAIAFWASVVVGLRVLDLWSMENPPSGSTHRLLGSGRPRHFGQNTSAYRSPLVLRAGQ